MRLFPFFHSYLGTSASLSTQSHPELTACDLGPPVPVLKGFLLLGFTPPMWHQGSSKLKCEILYQVMTGEDVHLSSPEQVLHPSHGDQLFQREAQEILRQHQEHKDRDYSKNAVCVTTQAESSANAESTLPFQLLTKHIGDNPSGDITISSSTLPDFYLLFFLTCLT